MPGIASIICEITLHPLPGTIKKLSKEFNVSEEEIRNYFGGTHYEKGSVGIHTESGPNGGIVQLDDSSIFERAKEIISNNLVSNK